MATGSMYGISNPLSLFLRPVHKFHPMIRILFAFLLLPFIASAQNRLDKSKKELRADLISSAKNLKGTFRETDSSMILIATDTYKGEVQMIYRFDKDGKTISETFKACDTCIKSLLKAMLSRENFQWKKINENQYVSKFADRILLELPVDPENYSFTLFRAKWSKEVYDLLLKQ